MMFRDFYTNARRHKRHIEIDALEHELVHSPPPRFQLLEDTPGFKPIPNLDNECWIYYGGHLLPIDEFIGSSLTLGASRSGKTLQLQPHLCSVIASIHRGRSVGASRRLVTYDAKGDMLPLFDHYCRKYNVPFYYFNLSDRRSCTFDFAKDLNGRSDYFLEFSKTIIPTPDKGEPFWAYVAQSLSHAGLLALQSLFGNKWGLHHYYAFALVEIPQLKKILSMTPYGQMIGNRFLPDDTAENTVFGFSAELTSTLRQIEVAAAHQYYLWKHKKDRFLSIREFLQSNSALLIATDISLRQVTQKITEVVTRNLTNYLGDKPDNTQKPFDRTFITIDELPMWGKLKSIEELVSFTPSKGSFAYLIIQDIAQMYDRYGRDFTNTIAGNCQWNLFFSPASADSTRFYSEYLGSYEFESLQQNYSYASGQFSRSIGFQKKQEALVLSGEARSMLPPATKETGSTFLCRLKCWNHPFLNHMTGAEIEKWKPHMSTIPLKVPRHRHEYTFPVGDVIGQDERRVLRNRLHKEKLFHAFMDAYKNAPQSVQDMAQTLYWSVADLEEHQVDSLHQSIHTSR